MYLNIWLLDVNIESININTTMKSYQAGILIQC